MDWTLEDNMVNSLFFCATLTGRRGDNTPIVQAGAETSNISVEAVKPDPGSSWKDHSVGMGAGVGDENAKSFQSLVGCLATACFKLVATKDVVTILPENGQQPQEIAPMFCFTCRTNKQKTKCNLLKLFNT